MGSDTKISWADHTFNPWLGCTPVGDGCLNCYAEIYCHRFGVEFGEREPRRPIAEKSWRKPHSWDNQAFVQGVRRKVFCGSMCDVFDKRAPEGSRERLWDLIGDTPSLDWLLLTKRGLNMVRYLPWIHPRANWKTTTTASSEPNRQNIWLGVTVENQKHGLPRIEYLRKVPRGACRIKFLSIEPFLEDLGDLDLTGIDWVIVGGESGHNARPMDRKWAESIRFQCIDQNIPFFMKQMSQADQPKTFRDIETFPSALQVRQFPP